MNWPTIEDLIRALKYAGFIKIKVCIVYVYVFPKYTS